MNAIDVLRKLSREAGEPVPPRIDVVGRVSAAIRRGKSFNDRGLWIWAIPAASCAAAAAVAVIAVRVWSEAMCALDALADPFLWMSL
jgi:hypothetical protein